MSDAEESVVQTNPEEDISKEIGETDYTEETGQENDFDVADLECVDEEETDRSEDRGRIKQASPKRLSRENLSSEHRYNPYKRSSESLKKNKNSPSKMNRDKQRKRNYIERKKNENAAASITNIDLDELEEIDSYNYEDEDNFSTPSTTSGTMESASATPLLDFTDNDEHDHWNRLQENGTDLQSDEEDFPTLSEDIDADLLEQIAQENIFLLNNSTDQSKPDVSEPSEQQKDDLPSSMGLSTVNGVIEEARNHQTIPKENDDDTRLEQRSQQIQIDKEPAQRERISTGDRLKKRLEKRKGVKEERQTDIASPSSHKSGERRSSREREQSSRDESSPAGYHDRQDTRRRRGRDDDIQPPSRKQIRNLLDQLVERNNRIRKEDMSEERRKTNHREENGESTRSGTECRAHSERRSSPQN